MAGAGVSAEDGTDLIRGIRTALVAAGLDLERLDPEQLAPLDHFHTGGRAATERLLSGLDIGSSTTVVDLGGGLGGPARFIARRCGARVVCIDRDEKWCAAARTLTEWTNLSTLVTVRCADALSPPVADASAEVVWMQNLGMAIEDKPRLYGQVRRMLRPGGVLALQVVVAGAGEIILPVPWAERAEQNFLVPEGRLREIIEDARLRPEVWSDVTDWVLALPAPRPDLPLSYDIYVEDAARKRANSRRNLVERRTRLLHVLARTA